MFKEKSPGCGAQQAVKWKFSDAPGTLEELRKVRLESLNTKPVSFTITFHFGFVTTDDVYRGISDVLVLSVLMCEP